ncbi:hypothetical protein [Euryhalocaulis caribicus]|uniref:hypothetical protein n=1 Tax=Euryhalocaulis caribicus TaxID=1161401 RepID=UPI0003A65EB4|nr:hypothetical protein [Euryhalocaulis caribicus]
MAKVTGAGRHAKRLKAMQGRKLVSQLGKEVFVAADGVRAEASRLISQGSVQGAKRVPSRPGEPPNWDTGQLAAGLAAHKTGPLSAVAESTAPYAAHLEFGTSKMAARPYMKPAAQTVGKDLAKRIGGALNFTIRKG